SGGGCAGESLGMPCGASLSDPHAALARQVIVAAVKGDWWSVLGLGLAPLEQDMWAQALNPIKDITKNDWCGIGYHCDDDDIASDCFTKATFVGLGVDELTHIATAIPKIEFDKLGDAAKKLLTSPGAKMAYCKVIGKKAASIGLKTAGDIFLLYGLYDFGKKFYKTLGPCLDSERAGRNYEWF
ncbi:MAG TPA: hypothetical protein VIW67_11015, partial [Terriglobales bacterium]